MLPTTDWKREEVCGVQVRGMGRGEVLALRDLPEGDPQALEIAIIAAGTDTPAADVRVWYQTAPMETAQALVQTIQGLSGLGDHEDPKVSSTESSED